MNALRNLTAVNAASFALALSDGTPVEFSKVTSRDRIQVKLPDSHPFAAGQEAGRIFGRDGTHYKNRTQLTLVATPIEAPAATPAAPLAPAAAPANDNVIYVVDGNEFDNLDDAKAEAIDAFRDTGDTIEIVAVTRKVIGKVGFTSLAA
jgi:hypothetical protein